MAAGIGTINELRLEPDGLSGWITCPAGLRPAPGQYLVASSPDPIEPLPVALFPCGFEHAPQTQPSGYNPAGTLVTLQVAFRKSPGWFAGMRLALRGPLGSGFHLPPTARRIAVASLEGSPRRLLPLAAQALAQRAAVTIYARSAPAELPLDVEVLPLDLLPEAPGWADFLALETSLAALPTLRDRLNLRPFQRPACQVQVLTLTAMPCSGLGECGVCAVATQEGWALACSDGPVFDFNQFEGA